MRPTWWNERWAQSEIDFEAWETAEYMPTPTIVEAAQALYSNHNVAEITRSDAGAQNLNLTTREIKRIVAHSKENNRNRLSPSNWSRIRSENNKIYLSNAYRVLLTRARQGFIIYVPEGVDDDATRKHEFYDPTFFYLRNIGIPEL